ncbi:hypothetical protein K458DRAFT_404300 [Lentithecium fluviatile CBS 122367]|uniref:F-box domain-containing protein n=1 Tax=Lentithecium fluviatile CBS 122367 TaxID=1168545 RepID=A0A6G1J0E6_9PLEO|nr:hypothetical protein K458DRAFT_404300 [Lentithecium fluviatile CBS 122367]
MPCGLTALPTELLHLVAAEAGVAAIKNLRLTCRNLDYCMVHPLAKDISQNKKLYPTHESCVEWLELLSAPWASTIDNITVVGETHRQHPYGFEWAWEHVYNGNEDSVDNANYTVINEIESSHIEAADRAQQFVTAGTYRAMLSTVLRKMPALRTITIQNRLGRDEHILGWTGLEHLRLLSGFGTIDYHDVFYGNWRYDSDYKMVTIDTDEYGETVQYVSSTGPQAAFRDDLDAVIEELNNRRKACGINDVNLIFKA